MAKRTVWCSQENLKTGSIWQPVKRDIVTDKRNTIGKGE